MANRTYAGDVGASDTWRIGAYGSTPGGFFDGVVDDVRIYGRALSAAEVQSDMNTPVASPDTIPPGAPGTLSATGSPAQAGLTWGAASDNVGVTAYEIYRSTSSGFVPSAATRIGEAAGTTFDDAPLAAGTYYYRVAARDAAGNVGPPSNQATATATPDATPPNVSITAPASGSTVSGVANVTASATDNADVVGVQFKVDGQNVGAEDTSAPYSLAGTRAPTSTAATRSPRSRGTRRATQRPPLRFRSP